MSIPPLQNLIFPNSYTPKAVMEANLDSTSVLCTRDDTDYEIRIFAIEEVALKCKKWNENLSNIDSELKNRIIFPEFQILPNQKYCSIRKFHSRTLEALIFFEDTLFPEEKHAICIQIVSIFSLLPHGIKFPFLPSRFLVYEDLYVCLTDLYEPNPVDEEAFEMGYYKPNTTMINLLHSIIMKIWRVDLTTAEKYRENYYNALFPDENHPIDEKFCPSWCQHFLSVHRKNLPISKLPPLLIFDIHRGNIISSSPAEVVKALSNISDDVSKITATPYNSTKTERESQEDEIKKEEIIRKRVCPIIKEMSESTNDLVKALSFFIIVKIKKYFANHRRNNVVQMHRSNSEYQIVNKNNSEQKLHLEMLRILYQILTHDNPSSNFISHCVLPSILAMKPAMATDILVTAIKNTDIDEQDELIVQLSNILRMVKSRATKIQIIDLLKVTDALFNSLQAVNPDDFNPDVVISKMSAQLFTQSQLRFLIHVSKTASVPLLMRFSLKEAMDAPTLQSLVRALVIRLSKRVHPASLAAIAPVYNENNKFMITPKPLKEEEFGPCESLVSSWAAPSQKPQFRPVVAENWKSSPIIISTGNAKAIAFTTDSRFLIAAGISIEMFRLESIKNHAIDFGRLPTKVPLPDPATCIATVPGYIYIGTEKSLYRCQVFDKIEKPVLQKLSDFESPITCIERISDSYLLIFTLKDGSVYACMDDHFQYYYRIPENMGRPISICSLHQKNEYMIGTDQGYIMSRSITLMCPIKIARVSNMPAYIKKYDVESVVITAGPFASIIDRKLSKVIIGFTQPPSHARCCCAVGRTLVTAHSDGNMYTWADGKIYSLIDGSYQRAQSEYTWQAKPSSAEPIHKSSVVSLINIPALTAAVSLDEDGVAIVWSII